MLDSDKGSVMPWSIRRTTTLLLELSRATILPLNQPLSLRATITCPTWRLDKTGGLPPSSCSWTALRYFSTTFEDKNYIYGASIEGLWWIQLVLQRTLHVNCFILRMQILLILVNTVQSKMNAKWIAYFYTSSSYFMIWVIMVKGLSGMKLLTQITPTTIQGLRSTKISRQYC